MQVDNYYKGLAETFTRVPFLMIPPRKLKSEGPVHNTLERFENGPFAPKTHQIFSNAHTTLEKFKPQQSAVVLDLCLRKTRAGKSLGDRDVIVYGKLCF